MTKDSRISGYLILGLLAGIASTNNDLEAMYASGADTSAVVETINVAGTDRLSPASTSGAAVKIEIAGTDRLSPATAA